MNGLIVRKLGFGKKTEKQMYKQSFMNIYFHVLLHCQFTALEEGSRCIWIFLIFFKLILAETTLQAAKKLPCEYIPLIQGTTLQAAKKLPCEYIPLIQGTTLQAAKKLPCEYIPYVLTGNHPS